jgi:hypothetical protein
MMQMIWRWIGMERAQIFYVLSFSNYAKILNNFENAELRCIYE